MPGADRLLGGQQDPGVAPSSGCSIKPVIRPPRNWGPCFTTRAPVLYRSAPP